MMAIYVVKGLDFLHRRKTLIRGIDARKLSVDIKIIFLFGCLLLFNLCPILLYQNLVHQKD